MLNALIEYYEKQKIGVVKAAPTGIAAINIGGATLHSLFKLPLNVAVSKATKYPDFLDETDVLIIDEISMLRIDFFDRVMQTIALANSSPDRKKSKDIQLIFCGDFFQLTSIIKTEDREILSEYYGKDIGFGFCFQSEYWKSFSVKTIMLKEVMRQKGDEKFCEALEKCKLGNKECIAYFNEKFSKSEIKNAIWVCGKNATVADINARYLGEVKGKLYTFTAEYSGEATRSDNLCDHVFECKVGARVMLLKNDCDMRYQNGSLGTVKKISRKTIEVVLDESGESVTIEKAKFPKMTYEKEVVIDKKTHEVKSSLVANEIGCAEQFPIRLGYAVTVHKAQGQTFDKMNFEPQIFAVAQLYVALSRCKKIENIYSTKPLTASMIRCAKPVKEFYSEE